MFDAGQCPRNFYWMLGVEKNEAGEQDIKTV